MIELQRSEIETFIRSLPDPSGARTFLERLLSIESNRPGVKLEPVLLSHLLTIASFSPFLGETILRHPEHIEWLKRETKRDLDYVKSTEQISEGLARFSSTLKDADHRKRLLQFKQREFLRIYLRDCLGIATLSELTEELSNLADVILTAALAVTLQEMSNLYGPPTTRDERGRIVAAEFAIVALGKLGCRELNYASDIDLLFLYSGEGETAGTGQQRRESTITNKEFYRFAAERVTRMIGSSEGQPPVYRIDLRLRPYGREGDLVWEVERAADYYRTKAHNWERQALIRARLSAGNSSVVSKFLNLVREVVFQAEPLPEALAGIRRAKEKIDRQAAARGGGFNVKLGRGGIREIEFIAQALQLAYGGRQPWVRSAQTLIVLARLAEKSYLSEPERTRLSAAYTFLRTVEHRLQMEYGAQTHTLPSAGDRLELLARRCGYVNRRDAGRDFLVDLEAHTSSVRSIYDRVFAEAAEHGPAPSNDKSIDISIKDHEAGDETSRLISSAAAAIDKLRSRFMDQPSKNLTVETEHLIENALTSCINPTRSLRNLVKWSESLATCEADTAGRLGAVLGQRGTRSLIERLMDVLSSQYLAQILVSRPVLASVLEHPDSVFDKEGFIRVMKEAVESEPSLRKADALRRKWYELVIGAGHRDLSMAGLPSTGESTIQGTSFTSGTERWRPGSSALRNSNLEQTALAEASLELAVDITLGLMGIADEGDGGSLLPFAVLGLGRLGHAGMDYGSDLDLLVVFDDESEWPPLRLSGEYDVLRLPASPQEFYASLTAQLVKVLSSVTREGFLYRIDLRLRPDGQSGPAAQGLNSLIGYLGERASAWEHSAYLKVREVAGDLSLGARAREAICSASVEAAGRNPSLREELARVRARLEREKARGNPRDIKWGPGGMTDVYFITRYLQLKNRVVFPTDRGTTALIAHLGECGYLESSQTKVLLEGYGYLRRLDHWIRLLLDRPSPMLPSSDVALGDIARAMGLRSIDELESEYKDQTTAIRDVYSSVFLSTDQSP